MAKRLAAVVERALRELAQNCPILRFRDESQWHRIGSSTRVWKLGHTAKQKYLSRKASSLISYLQGKLRLTRLALFLFAGGLSRLALSLVVAQSAAADAPA